jgi:hypothetical protein
MRRVLGWPTPIAIAYLVGAFVVALVVRWQGLSGSETPTWLRLVWVVVGGPLLVSGGWRAYRWMRARPWDD